MVCGHERFAVDATTFAYRIVVRKKTAVAIAEWLFSRVLINPWSGCELCCDSRFFIYERRPEGGPFCLPLHGGYANERMVGSVVRNASRAGLRWGAVIFNEAIVGRICQ